MFRSSILRFEVKNPSSVRRMPKKHKLPEWEKLENRQEIYLTLLGEPLTFTELQERTGFAKSTLSQHLKDMLKSGAINKAIKDGKVVYITVKDKHKIESELLKLRLEAFLEFVSKTDPDTYEKLKSLVNTWFDGVSRGEKALDAAVKYVLEKLT